MFIMAVKQMVSNEEFILWDVVIRMRSARVKNNSRVKRSLGLGCF